MTDPATGSTTLSPKGGRYLRRRGIATVKQLVQSGSGFYVVHAAPSWAAHIYKRFKGKGALLNYAIRRGKTDPEFCQAIAAVMDAYGSRMALVTFLRSQRPLNVQQPMLNRLHSITRLAQSVTD
jgi:hypothetical protein